MATAILETPKKEPLVEKDFAKDAMASVRKGLRELEYIRDETAHRVQAHPLKAVGIAAASGVVLGAAIGWLGARFVRR
jgi:ElaB/YqjD/DUF883 family membrane-anchored ribosome-binding protein